MRAHIRQCPRCQAEQAKHATSHPLSQAGPESLKRGDIIGRYVVIDQVGSGGMGVVYAAFDPELDRKVAIKLLVSDSPEGQAWILREAQAMARLSHPNVIPVFDVGTLRERVFVAMEFVDGKTMRDWFYPTRPWAEVVDTFVAAGRGLAAAHAAGVVHRDFKPDNILVGDDGRVRVMDFGLARGALDLSSQADPPTPGAPVKLSTPLTRADVLVGTPTYMAPEQMDGGQADPRTDQFGFGVSLYEALYGEMPFDGMPEDRPEATRWVVRPAPKPGPKVPPRIRKVVLRALSQNPDARYSSLSALLNDLTAAPGTYRMPLVWGASVLGASTLLLLGSRLLAPGYPPLCPGPNGTLVACQASVAPRVPGKALALLNEGKGALPADPRLAQARLEEAAWTALRTGDDDVAQQAAAKLVEVNRTLGDTQQAALWEKLSLALAQRGKPVAPQGK
jgi:hypothetical protein